MFTAALFTIAKAWKRPKCPSVVDWIKKMWSIRTMEHYSATGKDGILPFVTWMDLRAYIAKQSMSDGKGQEPQDFTHM